LVEAEILTLEEVAGYLRLSKKTIYKMARKGDLPAFKAGNHWRLTRPKLEEWIRRRTRAGMTS
jgi:excisionase family DNA binding protein